MNWIETIRNYRPYNEQEEKDKEAIIKYINTFDDILTRNNVIGHITSSGFVVNKTRDKALMIYHNIYNAWAWTGGHADGEEDLLAIAINEATEETGVTGISPISKDIISVDILPVLGHIKKGRYVSAHMHLSIAYLLEADESEPLIIKPDENSGVKWIPIDEIGSYCSEPDMMIVYNKIIEKMRKLK